jgi:hypothetical protein
MENYQDAPADSIVLTLENLNGRTIAFRQTPLGTPADDSLVHAVVGTTNAIVTLDAAVGAVGADGRPVDPMKLRKAVAGEFTSLQIRRASALAAVNKGQDQLTAAQDAFYVPEAVSELSAVVLDIERRAAFSTADPAERDGLWHRMAEGQLGPVLSALARFEFGATADRARMLYRALAGARDPDRVAAFELEDERLTWATVVLDQVTATIDAAANQLGAADAVTEPARKGA